MFMFQSSYFYSSVTFLVSYLLSNVFLILSDLLLNFSFSTYKSPCNYKYVHVYIYMYISSLLLLYYYQWRSHLKLSLRSQVDRYCVWCRTPPLGGNLGHRHTVGHGYCCTAASRAASPYTPEHSTDTQGHTLQTYTHRHLQLLFTHK